MSENMAKAIKVWFSFVKFVKNQVTVNGRTVDTQLIGLFGQDANGDVVFMPSPDYLEAGKFKLQRGTGSLVDRLQLAQASNLQDAYSAKYNQKLQVSVTTQWANRNFMKFSQRRKESSPYCRSLRFH